MTLRPFQVVGLGLLGTGAMLAFSPATAAGADLNQSADAPGVIVPRIPRRVAVQDEPTPDKPVPDAALEAPPDDGFSENGFGEESSVRRSSPDGTRILPRVTRDEYRAAYHAVPFSLAEHRANPGYRHAAAMKFLTGEYPPVPPATIAPPATAGPAFGVPGLGAPGFGPPPFVFDRVQGVVPTFVDRYQPPRVYLPGR
ncbi:hypothetical protein [Alienimonas californiensis]|uniref:Uncharacterized protein n=1 Tax=Alienimonas californiensis TaxID=2527989 RepID=A0A517P809_9PLAN|nr:hypothetical protein [Alienimonas californiensis]QDT15508.1 hypothetical protein CA12_15930 [Alienimonas californiensis]